MFKSDQEKRIESLARQYSQKDKRLSWESCLKKAKQAQRHFNSK
ncbi:TPA: hypothetical protein ACGU7T_004563 [Vibrio vulnificus]